MPLKTPQDYGKLIRDVRKANRVTQKELAAACGTGIRFIRELEKGKASCELGKAMLVGAMLGIRFEAILPKPMATASETVAASKKRPPRTARKLD